MQQIFIARYMLWSGLCSASVTREYCVDSAERIELIFGTEATLRFEHPKGRGQGLCVITEFDYLENKRIFVRRIHTVYDTARCLSVRVHLSQTDVL